MGSLWVVKPHKDRLLGVKATERRGQWEFSPPTELEPSALKGLSVVALDTSARVYFSRETLNKGPKEAILLQAEDKVRDSGYFTGAILTAIHKVSEGQTTLEAGILAVEPEGVNRLIETLSKLQAKVRGVYHQTMAMAHLVSRISAEPVLAIWTSSEGIWMIVCESGGPSYLRFQEVDELLGLEEMPIEESISAVLDYYERFFGKTIGKVFPCGPKRSAIPKMETLEPIPLNLEGLINAKEEDIFTYPELFGAVWAPEGYNLLPETQKFFLKNVEWIRPVAGLLLILAFVNLGIGAYLYKKNHTLSAEIVDTRKSLKKELSELNRYPPSQIEALKKYVDTKKKFEQQPRLDKFLWWLGSNLPTGMKVSSIKTFGKGHYGLEIELFLKGSAGSATKSFFSFLDRIKSKVKVVDTYFNYDEMAQTANFKLKVNFK